MARRAARVDENQSEIVEALRDMGCSVTLTHMVGDGFVDCVIGYDRKTLLMEIKGQDGERARKRTPAQIKWWEKWRGGPVAMVTDVEGAIRAVKMMIGAIH